MGMAIYLNSNFGTNLKGANLLNSAKTLAVKKECGLFLLTKPSKPSVELRILYHEWLK
jgi:hypothetical protein